MTDVVVPSSEVARRTIRRTDWVAENAAFIDCRTPGSDRKSNYAFIGPGVSQNSKQFINLSEPHGYNVGAAGMPNGVNNNLHLHFTAEVFINFSGEFRIRWGVDGKAGEYVSGDGDIISVPSWIFRGFTNEGVDDGLLLTVLGQDVTGGIIWGPSVLKEAESYGLHLTADNRLIDTVAGDELPPLMVAPYDHIGCLQDLPAETLAEMMGLAQAAMTRLEDAYEPHGYNVGFNQGRVAGAGVEHHIHMHVVPRWAGDNNFMPVIADTKVMPQSIEQSYEALKGAF